MFQIDGIVPIIPTPFTASGEIDHEAYHSLLDFAVDSHSVAVCLPAYASEFYKLSEAERLLTVSLAVKHSQGRIPVVAQINSPSLHLAVEAAKQAAGLGASALNTAVPRIFPTSEDDLLRYFDALLGSVDLPYLVQDFNPGGASVSPEFIARLKKARPSFCYIKLEEPLLAAKVHAIIEATAGGVGVLEGWGGMHTLELASEGICGVMPSLGLAGFLDRIYRLVKAGQREQAYPIFSAILPQIVYSLQNMELYHHCEKRLLAARGVSIQKHARPSARTLSAQEEAHIDFINARILEAARYFTI